jgi:hypothetical protein
MTMTLMETLKKRWYFFVLGLGIIILLFYLSISLSVFLGESFSTLGLYELNGSYIPQGTSFSLTDDDFKEFPQLASIIRDNKQKPVQSRDDGTRVYLIPLTQSEMDRFNNRYWLNSTGEDRRIFEYHGKYYEYTFPVIH